MDSPKNISLEFVGAMKQQVFDDLEATGLSTDEVLEIIKSWQNMFKDGPPLKKKGVLMLQAMVAGLHEYEVLANSAPAKSSKAFKDSLARMGMILAMSAQVALKREGKETRHVMGPLITDMGRQALAAVERANNVKKDASKHATDFRWGPGGNFTDWRGRLHEIFGREATPGNIIR